VGLLPFGGWSTDFFTANQLIIENLFYLCHMNLFHSSLSWQTVIRGVRQLC
jgi:hypothetical protein